MIRGSQSATTGGYGRRRVRVKNGGGLERIFSCHMALPLFDGKSHAGFLSPLRCTSDRRLGCHFRLLCAASCHHDDDDVVVVLEEIMLP